jgi:hypothetical protein
MFFSRLVYLAGILAWIHMEQVSPDKKASLVGSLDLRCVADGQVASIYTNAPFP